MRTIVPLDQVSVLNTMGEEICSTAFYGETSSWCALLLCLCQTEKKIFPLQTTFQRAMQNRSKDHLFAAALSYGRTYELLFSNN